MASSDWYALQKFVEAMRDRSLMPVASHDLVRASMVGRDLSGILDQARVAVASNRDLLALLGQARFGAANWAADHGLSAILDQARVAAASSALSGTSGRDFSALLDQAQVGTTNWAVDHGMFDTLSQARVNAAKWVSPTQSILEIARNSAFSRDTLTTLDAARLNAAAAAAFPSWLKPVDPIDVLLPSWQLTARAGVSGVVRPGLAHDVLSSLYRERPETVVFEAAMQLTESIDAGQSITLEQITDLYSKFVEAVQHIYNVTKDKITLSGMFNLVMLVLAIATYQLTEEQARLAREQTELARAAVATDPSPTQQKMIDLLQSIDTKIEEIGSERKTDKGLRLVVKVARLRVEATRNSIVIRHVYPDERVRVLKTKGNWAFVEVYEYRSETTVKGWISRRVLRSSSN